jgi:hypothetical protein
LDEGRGSILGRIFYEKKQGLGKKGLKLQYPHRLEAGMAAFADDDMVVDDEVEGPRRLDDLPRHGDIAVGRGGIAAGVVVDKDHGGRAQFEGALDDLARIDRHMVDRADLLDLVGDELVLAVEEHDAEMLALFMRHGDVAIIDQLLPGAQDRLFLDVAIEHAQGQRMHRLHQHGGILAKALDALEVLEAGGHDARDAAEAGEQLLGQRLDVLAGNRGKKHELEQLVILEGAGAGFHEALAQPVAVAVMVRRGFGLFQRLVIHRAASSSLWGRG